MRVLRREKNSVMYKYKWAYYPFNSLSIVFLSSLAGYDTNELEHCCWPIWRLLYLVIDPYKNMLWICSTCIATLLTLLTVAIDQPKTSSRYANESFDDRNEVF
jgi:hypothetical protein